MSNIERYRIKLCNASYRENQDFPSRNRETPFPWEIPFWGTLKIEMHIEDQWRVTYSDKGFMTNYVGALALAVN